jgi:di/tripeptidase
MSRRKQNGSIDEMVSELQKTHKNLMQIIRSYIGEHKNKIKKFNEVLNSTSVNPEKKKEVAVLKRIELVEMDNSITHTNNVLNILNVALLVKSVYALVENIEKQLIDSGLIQKVKEVEDTKKELLRLIKQLKEDLIRIEENRKSSKEQLDYIS